MQPLNLRSNQLAWAASSVALSIVFYWLGMNAGAKRQEEKDAARNARITAEARGLRRSASSDRSSPTQKSDQTTGQERINRDLIKQGIIRDPSEADFNLLDEDFKITQYSMDTAGLSRNDRPRIQKLIDDARAELGQLAMEKTTLDPDSTDTENGIFVYDVRPFTEEGEAILEDLKAAFRSEFGKQAGEFLASGIHPDSQFVSGKFQLKITISDASPNGLPQNPFTVRKEFEVRSIYPQSGKVIRTQTFQDPDILRAYLGDRYAKAIKY